MNISAILKNTLTANGTVNGNTLIVPAVAGKRIKVSAYALTTTYFAGSLGTIFTNGNGGVTLWSMLLQAVTGGLSGANLAKSEPAFIFATDSGVALYFNPAGQNVTYDVSYWIDDAF